MVWLYGQVAILRIVLKIESVSWCDALAPESRLLGGGFIGDHNSTTVQFQFHGLYRKKVRQRKSITTKEEGGRRVACSPQWVVVVAEEMDEMAFTQHGGRSPTLRPNRGEATGFVSRIQPR